MERKLNIGIIGCGVIAPTHIQSFRKSGNATVTWACDLQKDRAQKRATEFDIPNSTDDYHDLLDDPACDGVAICTDHGSHAPLVVAALAAGKHVLCEKALAVDTAGLDAVCEAARSSSPVCAGVLQHRFDPRYQALKSLLEGGDLGVPLTCTLNMNCLRSDNYYTGDSWRGTWEKEGGSVLINQAIHFIDIVLWINGGIQSVAGTWKNRTHQGVIETEDCAAATVEYGNGALGSFVATSSSTATPWLPVITVATTRATIELHGTQVTRVEAATTAEKKHIDTTFTKAENPRRLSAAKEYYGEGHPANVRDFLDAVVTGRPPQVTAYEARRPVDVVLALYQSHREQRTINLQ